MEMERVYMSVAIGAKRDLHLVLKIIGSLFSFSMSVCEFNKKCHSNFFKNLLI